jgi:F-type H+-transporting ATPase subunit alpha
MDINVAEIARALRSQIEGFQQKIDVAEVGTVMSVGDGIARIHGLERVMAGELLDLPHDVTGLALNLEEDSVGAVLFGESDLIKEGDTVRRTGRIASVPVGRGMIGASSIRWAIPWTARARSRPRASPPSSASRPASSTASR